MRIYGTLFIREKDDYFEIKDSEGKTVLKVENLKETYYVWERCKYFNACAKEGWNILYPDKEGKCYIVYKEIERYR